MTQQWLSPEEVERITRKKRWTAQCRALREAGIPFRRAGAKGDGEPLVRTEDVDADGKPAQRRGHRWDRIGSVRQLRP